MFELVAGGEIESGGCAAGSAMTRVEGVAPVRKACGGIVAGEVLGIQGGSLRRFLADRKGRPGRENDREEIKNRIHARLQSTIAPQKTIGWRRFKTAIAVMTAAIAGWIGRQRP